MCNVIYAEEWGFYAVKKRVFSPRLPLNILFSVAVTALLLFCGQAVAEGVRQGLLFLGSTLLPALFPFLILSEWLTQSGMGQVLTKPLRRPLSLLTGLSPTASSALLLGLLCGTPVGCLQAVSLWRAGDIGSAERDRLLLFSNNPGFGFMIGAVGAACGDRRMGLLLWLIVTGSALLLCALSRFLFEKDEKKENMCRNGAENGTFDLPECVVAATRAMLKIAGFSLAAAGLLGGLSFAVIRLPPVLQVLCRGMTELGAGVASSKMLSPHAAFIGCAFLAGFTGLTIAMQLRSLAEENAPPLALYLSARLAVGALSTVVATWLWRPLYRRLPAAVPTVSAKKILLFRQTPLLLLFILLTCSLLFLGRSRTQTGKK